MKIKDKFIYGLTMLPLLPQILLAETNESFYGGLSTVNGVVQVAPYNEATDIVDIKPNSELLGIMTKNSNTLLTVSKILVGVGIVVAAISVVYSGIQFANCTNSQSKEKAKSRLTFSLIGVALLGAIGLLINLSFSFFR